MTDIQGAIGVVQLRKLDRFISERQKWADYYVEKLSGIPWLRMPKVPNGYKHGWQSFVTFIDESISPVKRNQIMEIMQTNGIATRPGTHAVHMLNFYSSKFGIDAQDYPGAYAADQFSMSIPLHNRMSSEDFDYVISVLKSI
jgi:dTDP-4-amino-4,6-dideoxygalactose transaminase